MPNYKQIASQVGVSLLKIIEHRRGTMLLKVSHNGKQMALKCHDRSGMSTGNLVNEITITKQLGELIGCQYQSHGSHSRVGPWLLLRWIDGPTISQLASDTRQLPEEQKIEEQLQLFCKLVASYSAVHSRGILHGDVQPAHVLIENGQPVLIDWGLGRDENSSASYRGALVYYVAPEIADGMLAGNTAINYTVQAEIYSLGALMYMCMSGQTAVSYGSDELADTSFQYKLERVSSNQLRGFSAHSNQTEELLQAVVMQCLSLKPEARYQNTEQLLSALQTLTKKEITIR
jgi:serine/threonine protein kinase